jgi:hypothetical protein
MKQFFLLGSFFFLSSILLADEISTDTLKTKEPLLKAGFSIGLSASNFIVSTNPQLNTIAVQNAIYQDTGTFKSITTKPGIFLNLGFFVSTNLSDKLELCLNPMLRFNNANLFYEFTNGQSTTEDKQAIDFTNVELPVQLNYLFGNKKDLKFVHSIGLGYNFVFYLSKTTGKQNITSPVGGIRYIYDGVIFKNYFMNLEAYFNFRLSKKPSAQLITFKTAYSFTNLVSDNKNNNPYNEAITRMNVLSFGILFQIR